MKRVGNIDYTETQFLTATAERVAEKLVQRHNGDIKLIQKQKIPSPAQAKKIGFNFEEEVLWAARWLSSISPQ